MVPMATRKDSLQIHLHMIYFVCWHPAASLCASTLDLCFDQQACSCTAVPVPWDLLYLSLKSRSHSVDISHCDGAC